MTPEMQFECLLVSNDDRTRALMNRALSDLLIETISCNTPPQGAELLTRHDIDLVVCEYTGMENEGKLFRPETNEVSRRTPIIVAIVDCGEIAVRAKDAGAHVTIRRPLDRRSIAAGVRSAYSKMIREDRRTRRIVIMKEVTVLNERGDRIPITLTDITSHGVGFFFKKVDLHTRSDS